MRLLNLFSAVPLALVLSACVVPVLDKEESSSTCKTSTRSMSLQMVEQNAFTHGECRDQVCLAAVLTVFAGSAIISGSIVLTANTVHWLEYQGTCSDSYLNIAKQRFLESISGPATVPPAL